MKRGSFIENKKLTNKPVKVKIDHVWNNIFSVNSFSSWITKEYYWAFPTFNGLVMVEINIR